MKQETSLKELTVQNRDKPEVKSGKGYGESLALGSVLGNDGSLIPRLR